MMTTTTTTRKQALAAATTAIARCRDDNDDTIVGSNGFVRRLKQQSTIKGGTRGEMVMKWVKKEEERTTIEGRGHDDITIK